MMREFFQVMLLAALPALGSFAGGVLAEFIRVTPRTLSLVLHVAAGILLAVVGVELMPRALQADQPWIVIVAFVAGGGFFIVLDEVVELVEKRFGAAPESAGNSWMIFVGVAVDLLSDGIMIGAGASIDLGLGLLLALGQVSADVPEGFATLATFQRQGMPRARRLLVAASFAVPVFLGAALSFWLVRGRPELIQFSLLAFAAGVLITIVIEEIVPEAHRQKDARLAALALVGGFALFTFLSQYLA